MGDLEGETAPTFKARLYQHYLSQHVRFTAESVQSALSKRGPYLEKLIASYLPEDRSAKLLDVGCGYGGILYFLRKAGYTSIAGVDVSPEQVELAHHLGFADVRCQDIYDFLQQTPEHTYKAIIAFDILEHFTRSELLDLMDELQRVMLPGGRLIVHAPNGEALFSGTVRYGDLTHEWAFTRSSLHQLAGASGFRVVAVDEDAPIVHGLRSLVRYFIWRIGTFFVRLLAVADTGEGFRTKPLSQNLLAVLERT
jgi:2-polyprenyl-3-methyl-5-hydroxy-6-metoxy-1,4-benzoquinol methylase